MGNDTQAAIDHILNALVGEKDGEKWCAYGSEINECLGDCVQHLKDGRIKTESYTAIYDILDSLIDQACHEIEAHDHRKVEGRWRRLYTDSAILRGITTLLIFETHKLDDTDRGQKLSKAIRILDIAIVQYGAPGTERLEMLHQVINLLQKQIPSNIRIIDESPASHIEEMSMNKLDDLCLASQPVIEVATMPSLSQYMKDLHRMPFVVRGHARDWPALQDDSHHWSDMRYLEKVAGPCRVVPVEIGRTYLDKDWSQAIISWTDFLTASGWNDSSKSQANQVLYLAQHNLFKQFPSLEGDIEIPDIVYACPGPTSNFPHYSPPLDEDGIETCVKNAWIGPKGTTSPPHFDPYYNAYVQVVGQKLVWLANPMKISNDYSFIDGNTLDLDVFDSNWNGSARHDRIRECAMKVVLSPGDLLAMPPGWLHGMRSLTKSFSVSMWY